MDPLLVLPVHWSLVRVDALDHALEAAYGLSQVRCQLIKATINDTYLVWAAEGRFVLRLGRAHARRAEAITAELAAMRVLAGDEFQVARIVSLRGGADVLPLQAPEGVRFAVLFTFIEGRPLGKAPDLADARRYGRAVARMHEAWDAQALPLPRPRLDAALLLDAPLVALAQVLTDHEQVAFLQHSSEVVCRALDALPEEPPLFGLIHGDLIPSNTLLQPDNRIALLDFDWCGWGWRAYDLASYLLELEYWEAPPEVAPAFLQGYEEFRVLAARERALLPAFAVMRAMVSLGTPAQHVNEWGRAYLTERLVALHLDIMQGHLLKMQ